MLFEPDQKWTGEAELRIQNPIVQPDREGKVRLVIHNPSHEAKILGDSIHVGLAQLCDGPLVVQAASQQPPDGVNIDVNVVRSQQCGAHPDHAREQEISKMANVCETNLSSEEAKRLRSCILEASDVFAVEKDELGTVTDVQHRIKTVDNPPVKQLPRHIPFLVHPQMVNEMLSARY